MQRISQQAFYKWYFSNQTSLMQLKSQLLSAHLQRCLFYRARNCMKILFRIFDTKGHIHDGEVYHVHQDTFGFTLVWELQGWDLLQNISRITHTCFIWKYTFSSPSFYFNVPFFLGHVYLKKQAEVRMP